MSLIRRHPLGLEGFSDRMGRLLSEFFTSFPSFDTWNWVSNEDTTALIPSIEISERKDAYVVRVELPGVKRDDIDISILDDVLKVKGELKVEKITDEECHCSERGYGGYFRAIPLPSSVDTAKIEAKYTDGLLEIVLFKNAALTVKEATKIKVA
ncbi:MAG: Hsp20/alpha crystallin family protein [Candidatus Magnetoovum sp. WYHC-5]|nr:Hsp20/alpha crystallin family protein [Candidatus Magnetoovum sp. WYHC-5]